MLLKQNRGKVLELEVPDEFHARIMKALRKRKTIEMNNTINVYPEFRFTSNPRDPLTGERRDNILHVMLPKNPIDTI